MPAADAGAALARQADQLPFAHALGNAHILGMFGQRDTSVGIRARHTQAY
jgi:hypothetical protein